MGIALRLGQAQPFRSTHPTRYKYLPNEYKAHTMKFIFAMAFVPALLFLIGQFVLRFIYSYDIKNGAIRVLLFAAIPVIRIPISEVVQVTRASTTRLWLNPWYAVRLGNRIIGQAVLVQRKQGLVKSIVITPDDPDRFIDQCNKEKCEDETRNPAQRN
jgi:hypothetical protein